MHRLSLILFAVALFASALLFSATAPADDEPLVASERELVLRHLLTGELAAEKAVELVVPQVGIAPLQIRWLVDNGQEVAAGDPIVELDSSALSSNLEQLDSNLAQAQLALEAAVSRAGSEIAQAEFEVRQRRAALDKAVIAAEVPEELQAARDIDRLRLEVEKSELELAEAERDLEAKRVTAEANVEIERLNVRKATQKLELARQGTEQLVLRAPRDGVAVIQRNGSEDRLWQVGDNTFPGWSLVRLPDMRSLLVRARLFDVDDRTIAPAMTAEVILDAYPTVALAGRVRSIDRIAREGRGRSRTRSFTVVVDLEALEESFPERSRLLPGMSALVVVEQRVEQSRSGGLPVVAPRVALEIEGDGSAKAHLADGPPRDVVLGPCGPLECVVEEGLDAGTRLRPARPVASDGEGDS